MSAFVSRRRWGGKSAALFRVMRCGGHWKALVLQRLSEQLLGSLPKLAAIEAN